MLPPLYTSPTDWSTLYGALKICQGITTQVTPGRKTIISLDMQLYIKAVQLQSKGDVNDGMVFRMGELHAVFVTCRVVGKQISESGFDHMFIRCGIYGPTTMGQIIDGKHMQRCLTAYMILYLALHEVMLNNIFEDDQLMRDQVNAAITTFSTKVGPSYETQSALLDLFDELTEELKKADYYEKVKTYRSNLKKQAKFFDNIMTSIEDLMMFIRATRTANWKMHLQSLSQLVKYFFALDFQNYARMTPVYLASMKKLQTHDTETWTYLDEGNFGCWTSDIPFVCLGGDHAMEQGIRGFKTTGGPSHMTSDHDAMNVYFKSAPAMARTVTDFKQTYHIKKKDERDLHYELTGGSNRVLCSNVRLMVEAMNEMDVTFNESDVVHNVMSRCVLENDHGLLNICELGRAAEDTFVTERILGDEPVWSPMKKLKLYLFRDSVKAVKVKVAKGFVIMKEERGIMTKWMIASKNRPEIDLQAIIARHEFTVVPRALCSADGMPHPCKDKYLLLSTLEEHVGYQVTPPAKPPAKASYIIIDAMAIVNKISIELPQNKINTVQDFGDHFVKRVAGESRGFEHVLLVFDRYDFPMSLKAMTRDQRTNGKQVQFRLAHNTDIGKLKTKMLLSHVKTKVTLTKILAERAEEAFTASEASYTVVYGETIKSNMDMMANETDHTQEEADTLMIKLVNVIISAVTSSYIVVSSPDTDVFVLLLLPALTAHHQRQTGVDEWNKIVFRTGTKAKHRDLPMDYFIGKLDEHHVAGMVGFHSFSGCDQIGTYHGISKARLLKLYLASTSDEVRCFSMLGEDDVDMEALNGGLEQFLMKAYMTKGIVAVSIGELRWQLFSKKQLTSEKLPPTMGALKWKILRSHYVTIVWRRSLLSFEAIYPDPLQFGWLSNPSGNAHLALVPILTDEPPVPEATLDMTDCGCKKTKCIAGSCSCRKVGLRCTALCRCVDCSNISDLDNDLEI